jgi:NADH-quinone oxidoreductase subunit G
MMGLSGFDFETSQDVLHGIPGLVSQDTLHVSQGLLNNRTASSVQLSGNAADPVVASIYQLDGIVRRSPALQATADAKGAEHQGVTA